MESVFSKAERKEMIEPKSAKMPIVRQCALLSISRSTAYYKPSGPDEEEILIKNLIDRIYTEDPCLGSRRICKRLRNKYHIQIGRKLVRRYMREMGIDAIHPGPNLSKRNKQHHVYPYLLRNLPVTHNNHVWGIDLSYIGTKSGWMYLVVIIDWYSRFIVGWALSNTMHASFVKEALKKAIRYYGKPDIINSDQGSQFTCPAYIDSLKSYETIRISMNGKGRATDNAITERFIRSLKQEHLYMHEINDGRDAYRLIDQYMLKYNWTREHQSLNYLKPCDIYHSALSKPQAG